MEEAKLVNVRKSKKGKIIGEIQFADGKKMSIPEGASVTESLNNTECEVKRKDGNIVLIMVKGKEIYKKTSIVSKGKSNTVQQNNVFRNRGGRRNNYQRATTPSMRVSKAHAPYNFIPLNDNNKVVQGQERPDFDCYYKQDNVNGLRRFNGYVDCKLETITPLYIRDTYTAEELKKKDDSNMDNPEFFSPAGAIRIPGSSLRGMTRTLVEIMSWGKFGFCDKDRKLFFRAVGDTTSLGDYYRGLMMDQEDNLFPNFRAGLLKKTDNNYRIYPSQEIKGTQIYRVNFDRKTRLVANSDIKLKEFTFSKIYFKPIAPENHIHHDFRGRPYQLKYALVTEISTRPMQGYVEGMLVSSGNLGNKKHFHWIVNMPKGNDDFDITNWVTQYIQDENRDERINLLKELETNPDGVPCFYIRTETGEIVFGHTGLFRIPYLYNIGDHIPAELKKEEITDMAEAIFGKVSKVSKDDTFASRVFVEDAFLEPGQSNVYLSEQPLTPKILSNPKPTTFQHYLEQDPNCSQRSLNHWNAQGKSIRGNKLYWHRKASDWKFEGDKTESEKQITSIKPVKPNTKFWFKIRFENLSEAELGAILFALDLPKGHYHKLGMGKPLGLGSVKITPTLFIIDRESRYNCLFSGKYWHLGIKQVETKEFKEAFEKYVLENINSSVPLWDHKRMKQLKTMLDWSNTEINGWHKETEYMDLKEFRKRQVLPSPIEVKDKFSKD